MAVKSRSAAMWLLLSILSTTGSGFVIPPLQSTKINAQVPFVSHESQRSTGCLFFPTPNHKRRLKTHLYMASTYEQLREKLPSGKVIDAVIDIDSQGDKKVVASDVATRAGVSISQATKDLTALASVSQGDISVSNDGDLIYEFPPNLKGVLSSRNAKFQALQTWEKAWPSVFWGIRVGFGVALVASAVLIFSTLLVIQSSSSDDDRRRDDRGFGGRGGGFGGMNMWLGPSPFDFFYYRPYGYYGYYGDTAKDPSEMGFLESVFSYIFGDGDPNQGLSERSLSLAAQMIRDNKGAVTAEQLAPFCADAPLPDERAKTFVDESFVLPIVTQLNGEPQVTADGDIIYVFPELQKSAVKSRVIPKASESAMTLRRAGLSPNASAKEIQQLLYMNNISSKGALEKKDLLSILETALPPMTLQEETQMIDGDPSILQEREYKFSLASDMNKFLAGGLGVVNLGGALYLGTILRQYALAGVTLPGFLGVTQALYPGLLTYAVLFNIIPVGRRFWVERQNAKIQQRNKARKSWRAKLASKSGNLARKLKAAAKYTTSRKRLGANDVVFDTKSTTAADLGAKKEEQDMADFDKLLSKSTGVDKSEKASKKGDDDGPSVFQ